MALAGKRVLVTRAREQAAALVDALAKTGAAPVAAPAIRIAPPADRRPLQDAVARVKGYDWIIFTSVNGVSAFFSELSRQSGKPESLNGSRIAAIGPATAEALAAHGLTPEVVPDEYRAESVAEAILSRCGENIGAVSILLPRAAGAREVLPEMLRKAGARVEEVEAYRALAPVPEDADRLRELFQQGMLDVVTFTSSSTVNNTVKILGKEAQLLLQPLTVASIGPITTRTAQKRGLRVDVTASEYNIRGLVAALQAYFKE